ncbi:hypothetical protein M0R89_05025 [Halorussus limi]|uniref:Uncharacterized protein n=1 Tax=Halorussus limi TaxID=2938695 RepID=A0A8U0HWF3_9EURY|nr:hypothetical protein [Halorussus limi]UPV75432.1 hypothetical protein M0R89_05025 [Halorussus limi]
MNSKHRTLAVALVGALLLSSAATAGAASSATASETANSLSVTVEQAENDGATVTITQNGSAVENATVTVGVADENVTYAGAGDYATDANGTVELPEPAENVTVAVTAEKGNATGTTTVTLTTAPESDEPLSGSLAVSVDQTDGATVTVSHNGSAVENAAVTVGVTDENATYDGAGNYTTDANGTVDLPAPSENVTVEITAEKGNATGTATATLTVSESEKSGSFGDLVSSFVHEMMNAGDDGGPIGQVISDFVTENNPGNADEKRPDHAGKPDDAGKSGDKGKPDDAGKSGDKGKHDAGTQNGTDGDDSQGPPEGAGNDDGSTSEDGSGGDDSEKGNNGNGKSKGNGK